MVLHSRLEPGRRSSSGEFYSPFHSNQVDIIPSAGAIHTPHVGDLAFLFSLSSSLTVDVQILMLSGIGPAAQLAFHDVPPLVDLPGVGEHLMDHPVVDMNLLDKSGHSLGWMRTATGLNPKTLFALFQWSWMGTGPLTTTVSDRAVWYSI